MYVGWSAISIIGRRGCSLSLVPPRVEAAACQASAVGPRRGTFDFSGVILKRPTNVVVDVHPRTTRGVAIAVRLRIPSQASGLRKGRFASVDVYVPLMCHWVTGQAGTLRGCWTVRGPHRGAPDSEAGPVDLLRSTSGGKARFGGRVRG